ncbi:MAG: hypothetical protein NC925_05070 [Candidatus Omnitrophica bacterium]|nr:hypothetical protein [Candidatus Omnitrophota bacterium]
MKKIEFIISAFLIIASLVAFMIGNKIIANSKPLTPVQPIKTTQDPQPLNDEQMLTVKFIVDSLAEKFKISIDSSIEKNILTVSSKENNILVKYHEIMGFISSLNNLPYSMKYKSFCIGKSCNKEFAFAIEFGK